LIPRLRLGHNTPESVGFRRNGLIADDVGFA
jgi:hypothetical protein